jgi:tetratricopeptide (TPR) repeat protein
LYLGLHRAGGAAEAIAIADAVNETGNPRLDGVAGMLLASLEQSRRVAVVPRERLRVLRDAAGFPASVRLDGDGARAAAQRAGARLVLELSVTPGAPGFAFDLRGVDPARGEVRFALEDRAADESSVAVAVDRLSQRARAELGERAEDVRASEVQVGTALTTDLEAYRHYFLGEQCAARPIYGQDCSPHFRAAAERDPGFAAAHYQLALWSFWYGAPLAEQLATLARAVAHSDAAPEKERLLIQAWDAFLHGRDEDALATYRIVTERWPQDRSGWYQSGEILRRREELAAAIPWFERAVAVDPEYGWALSHLVVCLGATGRRDDLARWASRWETSARPAELHALVLARGWLGDLAAAEAAAKRAIALGGGVAAQEDLLAVWAFSGRYAEVEGAVRGLASPGSEVRPMGYYALAAMDAYRGRRRAGEATLDALRAALPGIERQALYHSARIEYLLGDRDPARIAPEIEALRALEPRAAAEHAAEVAWLGDLALARSLAAELRPGSVLRRTHDAVARVRRGETDAGLAELRRVADASPVVTWRVAPVYLLGELAAEAGRCEEAVAALRRFQAAYQPIAMWRSWALSRSRALVAACEAKAGSAGR